MAYLVYAMCRNLKPFKLDNGDPSSIFKTKNLKRFFNYHMSLRKLLIFMVIYGWHIIVYGW
jgi:hypothetical protein